MNQIVKQAVSFFHKSDFNWSICGGNAIDLFLERDTRAHYDLDISVFWEDKKAIIDFMLHKGWRVFEACGGGQVLEVFNDYSPNTRNLFCFNSDENRVTLIPFDCNKYKFHLEESEQKLFTYVEFLFNQRDDKYLYYSQNDKIKRELNKSILDCKGVQTLSPELVLLYKSTYLENADGSKHDRDFKACLPFLNQDQKDWLRDSLEILSMNKDGPTPGIERNKW